MADLFATAPISQGESSATDSLFFATFAPPEAAEQAVSLRNLACSRSGLSGPVVRTDRLHFTLHPLYAYSDDKAQAALGAGDRVQAEAFDIALDRLESFQAGLGRWPLVLRPGAGANQMLLLQRAIGVAMRGGLQRGGKSLYELHMTLLYGDRQIAEEAVDPICWTVGDFALVHSLVGKTEHRILRRWTLI